MEIPEELRERIENVLTINHKEVIEQSQAISKRYRENDGKGKRLVTQKSEAIAYAMSRMPATYCAVYTVLNQCLKNYKQQIKTVLDVGAGTGAATWAVTNLIDCDKVICLEREEEMRNIGKKLMEGNLTNIEWRKIDLTTDEIQEKADLVITSYVINELNKEDRPKAIKKMWSATNGIFVIIEPGTPEGFSHILEARNILLEQGANIVAPCTHNMECPIKKDDWCSFYTRVSRTKIQKQAKKGKLSYEDEKFSYIAFSKTSINNYDGVILRHPQIASGHVKVKVCTQKGIEERIYSKKDKDVYKKIRKSDAGDLI